MATSGTTSTLWTARDIIKDALIELQVVAASETPSAGDSELGLRRLNWMLKEREADGTSLWRFTYDGTATIPAGTATFVATGMLDISEARVVLNGYERPLSRKEWGEFVNYPNKDTLATSPTIYVPKPALSGLTIQLWQVPSIDVTINFTGSRIIEDVTSLDQNIDVPQQYTSTIMMNLADRLISAYGLAGDANAIKTSRQAAQLYQIMRASDRPASYFLLRA